MPRSILCTIIFFLNLYASAQQDGKQYNSLLWRITGNGLSKPSYLFGTMHLTDKRLFYFGDSLYKALEQTEGFAAELDMNTIFSQYVNSFMAENKARIYLDRVVDKEFLKKYKSRLEEKFKKPISKISTEDIDDEEENQKTQLLQSGEMKTFMDAYLFDIAARQGKWTGGIEDAEDQLSLKDSLNNTEDRIEGIFADKRGMKKSIEWMIDTYKKENLALIDRTEKIWKGSKDIVLLNRNVKMSYRIDSLSHVRSSLFVIGAAHLPGDSGVVSLLRKKGFTITPVVSSKQIAPENYTYKEVERKWVDVYMRDSLFSVQMPVKPTAFKAYESSVLDLQFHFDLGSYSAYFSLGIPANVSSEGMKDSTLDRIASNYRESGVEFSEKNIRAGNIPGREFQMKNNKGDFRIQVFVPGDYVALNAVYAMKKQELFKKDADRFLNSFKPGLANNNAKKDVDGKWQKFNFEEYAFSVELPGKYRSREEKENEESAWTRNVHEVYDIAAQAYYGIAIDEIKESYYSDKDSIYFQTAKEYIIEAMKAEIISAKDTTFQHYPAYNLIVKSKSEGNDIVTKVFYVNRGNRRYMLFKTFDPRIATTATDNRFFSSFVFTPLAKPKWKQTTAPDNSFTTWAPGDFKSVKETVKEFISRYSIHDKLSLVTVYVDKEVFPAYYWTDNDTSLYSEKIESFIGQNDSIIRRVDVKNGNTTGVDLSIWLSESQNIKRMRLLLSGDTLYTLFCFLPEEVLNAGEYEKFFNEFRINKEEKPKKIFIPKAKGLLTQLKLIDSTSFYSAKELLNRVPFRKNDLSLLQEALLFIYQDFDTTYYANANTNSILAAKVKEMDSANTSIEFIRKNYSDLTGRNELLKPFLLGILSSQQNKDSYGLLRDLLSKMPPVINAPYYFNNNLYDSLLLTQILFPDILPVMENEGIGDDITDLAVTMLDSNLISSKMIVDSKNVLIRTANRELAKSKKELEVYSYRYISLVRLLSEINDNETNSLVKKFADINDLELKMEVLAGLTRNSQAINRNDLLLLVKSDQYRYPLYDRLKAQNSLKIYPSEFLSQKLLGQSKVHEEAYEDDPPEKISFVGERIVEFMGEKKKFYLYKVMYIEDDPESYYLGIAGPYSLDVKDFNSSHSCTGMYWSETYDAKQMDKFLKLHLKETEDWLKEKEDKKIPAQIIK